MKKNPPKKSSVSTEIIPSEDIFFGEVIQLLRQSRIRTATAINSIMVETYWQIGRRIVEQEQAGKSRADYGSELLKRLSQALSQEFGRGFSAPNLRNFRQFYLRYPDQKICYTLCSELTWSHLRLIMRLDNPKEREYYLEESRAAGWTVRQLERNIHSHYYQRLLTHSDPKAKSSESLTKENILMNLLKDPYSLEFLGLKEDENMSESELENAIIDHLKEFLLEAGRGFAFVARQFRISTETSHFYTDLVFYNYVLKNFILIDLKLGKLTHQDIGQMDMYVRMFDDLKRGPDDNPTIGLILCQNKDETIVRYSVLKDNEQLFASRYSLVLPTEEELQEQISSKIRYWTEVGKSKSE